MRKSVKIMSLILAAMMVGTFSACGFGKEKMTKVRVSEVTHSVFYAPQYVAMNLGYFADEGIEIELSNGQGADKVMAAVLSDNIDIGFSGPEAVIYVYNEGKKDFPKVFAQVTKRDGSFLMGREKNETFDWNKLKDAHILPGRKGGVPYMTFEYVIKSKGLNPKTDMNFDDSIQFSLMAGAFAAGTGDYVTLFEPTATMFENEGKGFILASIGEESGEIPYTAYYAKQSYINQNPKVIEGFTRAIYKAEQWVDTHSAREIAETIAPSFHDTSVDILEKVADRYKNIDAWCDNPTMAKESFEKLQTVMTEAQELSQKANFDDVIENKFAIKVSK
ncbi:MAG: ABC transporter substrate-binding protein [Oscillospiraceae bacterium]